jgi:hypothetical protein
MEHNKELLAVAQLVTVVQPFITIPGFLNWSKGSATGPHLKSDKSSPYIVLEYFTSNFNIILTITLSSFYSHLS